MVLLYRVKSVHCYSLRMNFLVNLVFISFSPSPLGSLSPEPWLLLQFRACEREVSKFILVYHRKDPFFDGSQNGLLFYKIWIKVAHVIFGFLSNGKDNGKRCQKYVPSLVQSRGQRTVTSMTQAELTESFFWGWTGAAECPHRASYKGNPFRASAGF